MKRLLIVNNIPTPYRTFLFNALHERGLQRGLEVTVAFQARREARRAWKVNPDDMRFPHRISKRGGRERELFGYWIWNGDLLAEVRSGAFDFVLMAAFMSLTNWAAALASSGSTRKLLWSESNLHSTRRMGRASRWFKRCLVRRFDGWVCPGRRAVEYLRAIDPGGPPRPVLRLPNLVDNAKFIDSARQARTRRAALRAQQGVGSDCRLLLGIGRLDAVKGYDRLVEALASVRGNYACVILGDGPQRQALVQRVAALGLSDRVRLPGNATEAQVIEWLAAADWFVHPAVRDPSPLVCVEALSAGLPMLVSDRTGNGPEVLVEGHNGWSFDPLSETSIVEALNRVVGLDLRQASEWGDRSRALALERFEPDRTVNEFLDGLLNWRVGASR